jgi:hypothetical protein
LIWRVFLEDIARCKGRMKIIAPLTTRPSIDRVLARFGLASESVLRPTLSLFSSISKRPPSSGAQAPYPFFVR